MQVKLTDWGKFVLKYSHTGIATWESIRKQAKAHIEYGCHPQTFFNELIAGCRELNAGGSYLILQDDEVGQDTP